MRVSRSPLLLFALVAFCLVWCVDGLRRPSDPPPAALQPDRIEAESEPNQHASLLAIGVRDDEFDRAGAKICSLVGSLNAVWPNPSSNPFNLGYLRLLVEEWPNKRGTLFQTQNERQTPIKERLEALKKLPNDPEQRKKVKESSLEMQKAILTNLEVQQYIKKAQESKVVKEAQIKDGQTYDLVVDGFTYRVDSRGRPIRVFGNVRSGASTDAKGPARDYVAVLYEYWKNAPSLPKEWEYGHVVAASIGGNQTNPINFIPQHKDSNKGPGNSKSSWSCAEHVAQRLVTFILPTSPNTVRIEIDLQYGPNDNPREVVPVRGTYKVQWSNVNGAMNLSLDQLNADTDAESGVADGVVSVRKGNFPPRQQAVVDGVTYNQRSWEWTNCQLAADGTCVQ